MKSSQQKVEAEVQLSLFKRKRSEIPDAERVMTLQNALYQKAKQENYRRKSQWRSRLYQQDAYAILVRSCGLIDPTQYPSNLSSLWTHKMKYLGKPYAGKLHVRFDEGEEDPRSANVSTLLYRLDLLFYSTEQQEANQNKLRALSFNAL